MASDTRQIVTAAECACVQRESPRCTSGAKCFHFGGTAPCGYCWFGDGSAQAGRTADYRRGWSAGYHAALRRRERGA